jgi:membrane-associated protease RseP (regulator of RpoE activity)
MRGLIRHAAVVAGVAVVLLGPAVGVASAAAHSDVAPIVGRWAQTHRCQQLVDALNAQGLGALAPGVVGDYFPDQTYAELAAKPNLCSGAKPLGHSHFFTASGLFGSLDQFGNQVDSGTYEILGPNTLRINNGDFIGTFGYSIRGNTLALTPLITEKQRREALKDPAVFSAAGWMVAVSYPGTTWEGVPCEGWC